MEQSRVHSFHIPVLGLAFSIDTPIRVGRFGISSVVSIVDDILVERMRKQYARVHNVPFIPIEAHDEDHRARRITAYLDLMQQIVHRQMEALRASAFEAGSEIVRYFELLPDASPLKSLYKKMTNTSDAAQRSALEHELRENIVAGDIDVNIMTKLDKINVGKDGKPLPFEFSDALAALRGFAQSTLRSSVVLSAGLNQRLFSYIGQRPEFAPEPDGTLQKKVILKVSDYRSALIQGKILAKKGVWTSEFRIESGLNCGGHAFATDGYMLGPILEEFKQNREFLGRELNGIYAAALLEKGVIVPPSPMTFRITVQGGIGTAEEDKFLREHYGLDGTGWGSPFLLVPEATNLDPDTRMRLARAKEDDFYLSYASPLGIRFNNLRETRSEQTIWERFAAGRPGSPCKKKFLVSNTEFTTEPICTASRQFQKLKIDQLDAAEMSAEQRAQEIDAVVRKACLCEDLAAAAYITDEATEPSGQYSVAVCPGPNLAFFDKIATLEEMVGHIYGRVQLLANTHRPHMFVNELRLYVDYLKEEVQKHVDALSAKEEKHYRAFQQNIQSGIAYYNDLLPKLAEMSDHCREEIRMHLNALEEELASILLPEPATSA